MIDLKLEVGEVIIDFVLGVVNRLSDYDCVQIGVEEGSEVFAHGNLFVVEFGEEGAFEDLFVDADVDGAGGVFGQLGGEVD